MKALGLLFLLTGLGLSAAGIPSDHEGPEKQNSLSLLMENVEPVQWPSAIGSCLIVSGLMMTVTAVMRNPPRFGGKGSHRGNFSAGGS